MITTTPSKQRDDQTPTKLACPACGEKGRKVKRVTLESLLRPERRDDIGEDQYCVCTTPRCETVYFSTSNGQTFRKSDLTVRFGLKETHAPRHVCYCFDHTAEDIGDEIHRTGKSTVVESIKAKMKEPGCRCEYTNPLGGCCLKTVQAEVDKAFRSIGHDEQPSNKNKTTADCCKSPDEIDGLAATASDCCQAKSNAFGRDSRRERAGILAAGGSIVAAILSSACCWLPLVLIAFGVSAAGVAGFFAAYRLYFIVAAVGLLGSGFYFVYFRQEQCEPGSACATPHRKLKTFHQVMLWTATVLVGAFVMFPNYVGFVLGSPAQASSTVDATRLTSAQYHIEGMTCEGCASILHDELLKLPEVKSAEVDFATKSAVVHYEPSQPVPSDRVIEVVKAAGYSATPAEEMP